MGEIVLMSAGTDATPTNRPPPAGKRDRPKPALGRPHDTFAALALVVSFAAVIYASGNVAANSPTSWPDHTVFLTSLVALIGAVAYFTRAYGFSSRGLRYARIGIRTSSVAGYLLVILLVSPALHESYGGEREVLLVLSCLGIAILAVMPFTAALGRAPERKP